MNKNVLETLRNNIKYYRVQKGLTQEKLSELTNISKDYLSEIERGKKTPSLKRLDIIASALKIDTYLLLMPVEQKRDII